MKQILLLITLSFLTSCSTIKSSEFKSENIGKSLHYALPKTLIDVVVEIERTEIKSSKYQDFALCYGIISKKKNDSVYFSIKSITTSTSSELDENNIYQTKIVDGFLNKNEFSNQYNLNGELTSADYKSSNISAVLISKVVELGTGILTKGAVAGPSENECFSELSKKDSLLVADKLERIKNINTKLDNLISDSDQKSLEIIKFQYDKNNNEKKEILSKYFTYKTEMKPLKVKFKINPNDISEEIMPTDNDKNSSSSFKQENFVILEFLRTGDRKLQGGIVDNKYVKEKIWNRKQFANKFTDNSKKVKLVIRLDIDNKYAAKINPKNSKPSEASFYYRIPSNNIVKFYEVSGEGDTKKEKLKFISDKIQLTQFGRVIGAPSNLGDAKFELYPNTGALKSISGKSSNIDLEQLDALKSQVLATQKAIKGNEEIDDEIAKLKKEVELLELLEKKEELEKEKSDEDN